MVQMTPELLEQMRTDNGGYTKATAEALGLQWGKGWPSLALTMQFTEEQISAAIAGRTQHKARAVGGKWKREEGNVRMATPKQVATLMRFGVDFHSARQMTAYQAWTKIRYLTCAIDRAKELNRQLDEAFVRALAKDG